MYYKTIIHRTGEDDGALTSREHKQKLPELATRRLRGYAKATRRLREGYIPVYQSHWAGDGQTSHRPLEHQVVLGVLDQRLAYWVRSLSVSKQPYRHNARGETYSYTKVGVWERAEKLKKRLNKKSLACRRTSTNNRNSSQNKDSVTKVRNIMYVIIFTRHVSTDCLSSCGRARYGYSRGYRAEGSAVCRLERRGGGGNRDRNEGASHVETAVVRGGYLAAGETKRRCSCQNHPQQRDGRNCTTNLPHLSTTSVASTVPRDPAQAKDIRHDTICYDHELPSQSPSAVSHLSPCNGCHPLGVDLVDLGLGKVTHEQVLREVGVGGKPHDTPDCVT